MSDDNGFLGTSLGRRTFFKTSALLGGTAAIASQAPWLLEDVTRGSAKRQIKPNADYALARPENIIYSACLQCQVRCLIKVKHDANGVVTKIDGSPYSPKHLLPSLAFNTSLEDAALVDGKLCPKGQAGVQTLYDPYRIRQVLKRVGPRGSGKWQTIDFDTAIDEVLNGGDLFGEGKVEGLKDVYALRDAKVAADMSADVDKIKKRQMTVAEFKTKHAANLGVLIDPEHPDLGPKNNQFVFMPGRINRTRIHFANRFVKDAFGSVNSFEHTSICELSIFVNTSLMTGKNHFKPDFLNSEFVMFWGTGFAEANFGPTPMAQLVTDSMVDRGLKVAVVDPRLSKSAAKAWRWLPVKPGADAALGLAMIRWIIENERYDMRYLENPNMDAAKADGETSSTDATHLIRTDKMELLRAEDASLAVPETPTGQTKADYYVVMTGQGPQRHDQTQAGQLDVSTTVNGIPVKSVFTLLKEGANEKTLDQYAEVSGVSTKHIVEVAQEFTSHGKKAAIDMYRGPAKHTNGFHAVQAINILNALIGNMDWKGGLADGGGSWDDLGGKEGQPYRFGSLHPNKTKAFGLTFNREGWRYEESTLFDRDKYPAKRPWFPFGFNVWQDIIPSAEAKYPYPIKVLWLHMGTPAYSVPGAFQQNRVLRDPKNIPLVIATDIVVGDTTMYADYVFPDISYLEQWASPGDVPQPAAKSNPFRQPAVAPIPEAVTVDGEQMPLSLEAVLLAMAKKLSLPGWGKDGFASGTDLKRPEDYYLKVAANLAFGDKADGSEAVPDASDSELAVFRTARRHLPASVYDEAKWRQATGDQWWKKAVYILNRGGRFEQLAQVYDGDKMTHRLNNVIHLFIEKVARQNDSITGQRFDGLPRYAEPQFADGKPVGDRDFAFNLITYKAIQSTQARMPGAYWTRSLEPENFILLNNRDASQLKLEDGDVVRLESKSNPSGSVDLGGGKKLTLKGKVKAIEGIRPGVVAISQSYGHWAYGGADIVIDGETVKGDDRRTTGLNPNSAMRLDEHIKTGPLSEPIGGSAVFYDTRVNLVKV